MNNASIIPIILIGCSSISKSQVITESGYLRDIAKRTKNAAQNMDNVQIEVRIVDVMKMQFDKLST